MIGQPRLPGIIGVMELMNQTVVFHCVQSVPPGPAVWYTGS